jgi:hypothetical protein
MLISRRPLATAMNGMLSLPGDQIGLQPEDPNNRPEGTAQSFSHSPARDLLLRQRINRKRNPIL